MSIYTYGVGRMVKIIEIMERKPAAVTSWATLFN